MPNVETRDVGVRKVDVDVDVDADADVLVTFGSGLRQRFAVDANDEVGHAATRPRVMLGRSSWQGNFPPFFSSGS
ncbi:hypothetical protein E4U43_002610 [Claviceps pusilla]|uniref:Uncharacterized protein n=1 Tax=Claviceps pusilla TaxID=123648 RepID=A0A9P7N6E9_9HYPO|nr:hypothetical protein E4U43_002610 [Claviceps pusilla]